MTGLTFADPALGELFADNGWRSFEDLWRLEAREVEPGNVRRGGWSSVVRFTADEGSAFYLKRQEDHDYRGWEGGIVRRPTVVREWQAGVDFRGFGIPTAEPVCLGVEQSRTSRGILVTRALDEHEALTEVLKRLPGGSDARRDLWYRIADAVRLIHDQGYRHNCLYGQHILVRKEDGTWDCAFIDLEKATRTRRQDRAAIADLSALDRHTDDMSLRDREWLWDRYFRDVSLAQREKLLKVLTKRSAERGVSRYIRDCAAGRRGEMARGPSA
ncbi:MAG: hypothetical protein EP301_03965 [Gammaproteobacteria bacterium]|jgi:tRNA A-37 threonylcarbamoyl transferase component Bud32|nr:MAG: hypothetical protein EP301_03965 [Gammaproteobacteria bacterium]